MYVYRVKPGIHWFGPSFPKWVDVYRHHIGGLSVLPVPEPSLMHCTTGRPQHMEWRVKGRICHPWNVRYKTTEEPCHVSLQARAHTWAALGGHVKGRNMLRAMRGLPR